MTYLAKPVSPLWQPARAPAGCKLYMPLCEGSGATRDFAAGQMAILGGGATWGRGVYGPCLRFAGFGQWAGFSLPSSGPLRLPLPITVAVLFTPTGTPSGNARLFALQANDTFSSPFLACGFFWNSTPIFEFSGNSAGTFWQLGDETTPVVGQTYCYIGVATAAGQRLYRDGQLVTSNAGSYSDPNYDPTALLTIGSADNDVAADIHAGGIFSRDFSDTEALTLAADLLSGRFSAVRPRSSLALFAATVPPATTIFARRGLSNRVGSRGVN